MITFFAMFLALLSSFIGSIGAIYIKKGTLKLSFSLSRVLKNSSLLVGLLIYGISAIIFIFALREGELSAIYPLAATSYIWITLFSKWYLHERITKKKIIAIACIIVGVIFIGL